jgi:hypothetical protein
MSKANGLPVSKLLWRYRVWLETESGELKEFSSVLLNHADATRESVEMIRHGRRSDVVLDKKAAEDYRADKEAADKERRAHAKRAQAHR